MSEMMDFEDVTKRTPGIARALRALAASKKKNANRAAAGKPVVIGGEKMAAGTYQRKYGMPDRLKKEGEVSNDNHLDLDKVLWKARLRVEKGDYPGHPFRGNQYTRGKGGGRGALPPGMKPGAMGGAGGGAGKTSPDDEMQQKQEQAVAAMGGITPIPGSWKSITGVHSYREPDHSTEDAHGMMDNLRGKALIAELDSMADSGGFKSIKASAVGTNPRNGETLVRLTGDRAELVKWGMKYYNRGGAVAEPGYGYYGRGIYRESN